MVNKSLIIAERTAAEIDIPINIHAKHYPEAGHNRQHDRAAVRNQRQRDADYRQQPQNHGNVNKNIHKIVGVKADDHQFGKVTCGSESKNITVGNDHQIKQNHQHAADHAEFFRKHRKNKVCVLFG